MVKWKKKCIHHIPGEVRQPVGSRIDAGNELQMLCVRNPFIHQEQYETGRDKGQREYHTDCNQNVPGSSSPEIQISNEIHDISNSWRNDWASTILFRKSIFNVYVYSRIKFRDLKVFVNAPNCCFKQDPLEYTNYQ